MLRNFSWAVFISVWLRVRSFSSSSSLAASSFLTRSSSDSCYFASCSLCNFSRFIDWFSSSTFFFCFSSSEFLRMSSSIFFWLSSFFFFFYCWFSWNLSSNFFSCWSFDCWASVNFEFVNWRCLTDTSFSRMICSVAFTLSLINALRRVRSCLLQTSLLSVFAFYLLIPVSFSRASFCWFTLMVLSIWISKFTFSAFNFIR